MNNGHPHLDESAVAELLGRIAEEFTRRCDAGEEPDVEDYARRHPAVGDILRQVLPALQALPGPAAACDRRDSPVMRDGTEAGG